MTYTTALGIDLGTSGVRAAVVRATGKVVAIAKVPHRTQTPGAIDASLWWDAVVDCLRQLATFCDLQHIDALGVDGTSGTLVLVDDALMPVAPALMYNSSGFEAEAAAIDAVAPAGHITRGPNSALARALRLRTLDRADRGRHLLHQADFILAQFARQSLGSDCNNALKTGFDPAIEQWPDWFSDLGSLLNLLPQVRPAGTRVGTVHPTVAADLNLPAHMALHLGTTDSLAAHVATGALARGDAVTSLGTTMALKIVSERRIDNPALGLYSHRLGPRWLVGGASNTGGGVLSQFFSPERVRLLSARIDPRQPTGLNYYPLASPGERFPVSDPYYPPQLDPRPQSDVLFLQGLLEGMAQIEARAYAKLVELGAPAPRKVLSTGGGANNKIWQQIRAQALGLPVEASPTSEACVGAANLCFM